MLRAVQIRTNHDFSIRFRCLRSINAQTQTRTPHTTTILCYTHYIVIDNDLFDVWIKCTTYYIYIRPLRTDIYISIIARVRPIRLAACWNRSCVWIIPSVSPHVCESINQYSFIEYRVHSPPSCVLWCMRASVLCPWCDNRIDDGFYMFCQLMCVCLCVPIFTSTRMLFECVSVLNVCTCMHLCGRLIHITCTMRCFCPWFFFFRNAMILCGFYSITLG